jgi:hypothetical protein
MSRATQHLVPEADIERVLLEAAVAEARQDPRQAVPHDVVRSMTLAEVEWLKRKATAP